MHKGGSPLGPVSSFFASPVKKRKDFFHSFFSTGNCLNIGYASFLWKKIDIDCAVFTLISINEHYLMHNVKNLVLAAILKWNIFFFKFYFKDVNVFMFFNLEPNFIEKFLWKSGFFFQFWSHDYLHKTTICFSTAIFK